MDDTYNSKLLKEMYISKTMKDDIIVPNIFLEGSGAYFSYVISESGTIFGGTADFILKDYSTKYKLKDEVSWSTKVPKTHNPVKVPDRTIRPVRKIIVE